MVSLREIDSENFWVCIGLEVAEYQKEFVTSNAVSLAQSKYQPECIPLGIYSGDEMVGFMMYCIDADDGEYWIYRMMTDKRHQGKGYARQAMELLVQRIKGDDTRHAMLLGVHTDSKEAVALYKSFGFEFTGQVFGAEHIMKYEY
jgi:diamine N-acetyltransferase